MSALYDLDAPKKPINLSVNSDLLAKAKALGINLSRYFEESLSDAIREEQRRRWEAENAEAMEERNRFVEAHSGFWSRFRNF